MTRSGWMVLHLVWMQTLQLRLALLQVLRPNQVWMVCQQVIKNPLLLTPLTVVCALGAHLGATLCHVLMLSLVGARSRTPVVACPLFICPHLPLDVVS